MSVPISQVNAHSMIKQDIHIIYYFRVGTNSRRRCLCWGKVNSRYLEDIGIFGTESEYTQ